MSLPFSEQAADTIIDPCTVKHERLVFKTSTKRNSISSVGMVECSSAIFRSGSYGRSDEDEGYAGSEDLGTEASEEDAAGGEEEEITPVSPTIPINPTIRNPILNLLPQVSAPTSPPATEFLDLSNYMPPPPCPRVSRFAEMFKPLRSEEVLADILTADAPTPAGPGPFKRSRFVPPRNRYGSPDPTPARYRDHSMESYGGGDSFVDEIGHPIASKNVRSWSGLFPTRIGAEHTPFTEPLSPPPPYSLVQEPNTSTLSSSGMGA